jgi:hypothetical protein
VAGNTLSQFRRRDRLDDPPGPDAPASRERAFWLEHCEGFSVEGAEGKIGLVEEVRHARGGTMLAVRAGKLGHRLMIIPLDEVAFVLPRSQRISLRAPATILASESRERED